MFFGTPAKGVVDIAVTLAAVCLFDAYFAQAVFGVVVIVLSSNDGLFGLGSAVLVVAVVVTSEMQELVTANQVVIAVVFSVFAVQQVGGSCSSLYLI
ncbi:hypothetical protein [Snodgrassella alvi]|uniref:hypothetical protein n=1 Tax=Snodgrassella alvi TaxID=1196083 RepID=UPI000CA957D1|nr:hypothetical protein [Snodgrassella alvi]PIT14821.1 hypothetical protein BGI33_07335 [Snodgrassella alvi]PIT17415.1 hypothetical protein BGI34_07220 [Snodgrassella alvi]